MATTGDVHVGDVGTVYRAKVQDGGAAWPDLAGAIIGVLIWKTPSGLITRTLLQGVTITTDGTDYYLQYKVTAADVAAGLHLLKGAYSWQGYVEFPGGVDKYHTNIETFTVSKNLN